jgi:hypothetical protein
MPSPPRVRQSRFVLLRFCVPFIGETLDRSGMTSSVCRRSHLSLSLSLFCKVCARPRRVCFPREDEDDLLRRRFRRQKRVVSKNRFRFYLELLTKSVPSSFSFPPSLLMGCFGFVSNPSIVDTYYSWPGDRGRYESQVYSRLPVPFTVHLGDGVARITGRHALYHDQRAVPTRRDAKFRIRVGLRSVVRRLPEGRPKREGEDFQHVYGSAQPRPEEVEGRCREVVDVCIGANQHRRARREPDVCQHEI